MVGNGFPAIDQQIAGFALTLRDTFQQIIWYNESLSAWAGASGPAAALETAYGISAADAATLVAALGNLADLANKANGQSGGVVLPFNYMANTQSLWGGQ